LPDYVIAVDQGTTSTRAIAFTQDGTIAAVSQREHEQLFPQAGWVEHDPTEIRDNVFAVLASVRSQLDEDDTVAAIGITNQRETAIVWDRSTGEPIANAIVWQDTRTAERIEELAEK
jgi:glycerol kinase